MNRNEYPRPQFQRNQWTNLNGSWDFRFDDSDKGLTEKWYTGAVPFDQKITVPFVYQSEESGIGDRTPHDVVWYKCSFSLKETQDKAVILHFGAVDYEADVYVNGSHVYHHIGGHTSFKIDITPYITTSEQLVAVRAFDPHKDETIPRGKQFWEDKSRSIWYTNSTGIWQTVWLEVLNNTYLDDIRYTSLFDEGKIRMEASLNRWLPDTSLRYTIRFKDELVAKGTQAFVDQKLDFAVDLIHQQIFRTNFHDAGCSWTPENPNLFEVAFEVVNAKEVTDTVESYFGFRKIAAENGMTYLNNKPCYQKLVLDQGYWPTGLLTAPTDEDYVKDIQAAKEMGFNGCRKHQKTEDPRFLYWADKLGFLVWGECAAPPMYADASVKRLMQEWGDIIQRDYSHPCIVTWVPINESWGVPQIVNNRQQQHFSQTMYHYLHSLDTTRLVISNDGWGMTETDICAIHNYAHGTQAETAKYAYFKDTLASIEHLLERHSASWRIYADGFSHQGSPIMLTEFGGIGYDVSGEPGWGYTSAANEAEFLADYQRILDAIYHSEVLAGYCYTQLSDVEQEINGLLTYDRQPKCDLAKIRAINDQWHPPVCIY